MFCRLYSEEGKGKFTVRNNVLGHMQQGGWPSPFDRNVGTKMAAKTVTWLIEQLTHCAARDGEYGDLVGDPPHGYALGTVHADDPSTATLLGMRTRAYRFQPVQQIKQETDFKFRSVELLEMQLIIVKFQGAERRSVVDEDQVYHVHPCTARLHVRGGGLGPRHLH